MAVRLDPGGGVAVLDVPLEQKVHRLWKAIVRNVAAVDRVGNERSCGSRQRSALEIGLMVITGGCEETALFIGCQTPVGVQCGVIDGSRCGCWRDAGHRVAIE